MSFNRFVLPVFDTSEKELHISNNEYVELIVGYDDVDHYVVEELLQLIVPTLNNISQREWQAAIVRARARSASEE